MTYHPDRHHRRSVRLKGYDYGQAGAYYVTIVTHERACVFGDVVDDEMRLNEYGDIVHDEWRRTAAIRDRVALDEFVVMPNHVHGIIVLTDPDPTIARRGTLQRAPTRRRGPTTERFSNPTSDSIPTIIRLFKSATTKRINQLRAAPGLPVWQRNYYEHVIRDDDALHRIRQYILENPVNWATDHENPAVLAKTTSRLRHFLPARRLPRRGPRMTDDHDRVSRTM